MAAPEKTSTEKKKDVKGIFQSSMNTYTTTEEITKKLNELLYTFFNTANISINQTGNTHLNELMRLLIDNSHLLKYRRSQISFSPWRYKVQECKTFNNFIMFLTKDVTTARDHYKEMTGKQVAFITIGHDA